MAKRNDKNDKRLHYPTAVRELKEAGPKKLYLLWGPEDYLREDYLAKLKKLCLPEGEDSFSFKRLDGPELDPLELQQAIDAMPFMTERSFVEIRGVDLNKLASAEQCLKILSDIPDYCTVAFVQSAQFEPDGRLKAIKGLRELAEELRFTQQPQGMLIDWIARRFAAAGKGVELEAAQRLIFISGDLMSRLIPEIDKIAAYTTGDKVRVADVEAVANHIPEAVIFDMTDQIAQKQYNAAIGTLAELLADKKNEPIPMLAMLGVQMRKLYAARLAIDEGLGSAYVMEVCAIKHDFIARRFINAARGFRPEQLKRAVELCAETDYRIKSSGEDDRELFKEVVLRIAAGESDARD
ncbi:MAG: DNA polymerase III subunit delta [Oscillospiraceae bacterium]|nr:DNA polymerase III subunit delta [Oscillospiraceae bacterium]